MKNHWDKYIQKWKLDNIPVKELSTFEDLLLEWNEKINITRITSPEDVEVKHFLDSLSIFSLSELAEVKTMIDIGTGGGFPGIPAKLYRKDLKVTLVDSLNKRIKFLDEVIRELDLKEMETIHGRAEELGRDVKYRERFDLCVSRAVANLRTLSEYCLPFVKPGKYFLAMKGSDYKEEIEAGKEAITILGGEIIRTEEILLPGDILHSLILIKKVKKTPKKYPRAGGKPKKDPL
ncbi:MAG: 16S rRNA (guanine(527)-N(7))-methyltransferase RsmG [Tissierellia bacterium]|nr:16S rRNA (guanine(527)-N(7))-methyltransferase RsmG [Tissierellia bacterium]